MVMKDSNHSSKGVPLFSCLTFIFRFYHFSLRRYGYEIERDVVPMCFVLYFFPELLA